MSQVTAVGTTGIDIIAHLVGDEFVGIQGNGDIIVIAVIDNQPLLHGFLNRFRHPFHARRGAGIQECLFLSYGICDAQAFCGFHFLPLWIHALANLLY